MKIFSCFSDLPEEVQEGAKSLPDGYIIIGTGERVRELYGKRTRYNPRNVYQAHYMNEGRVIFIKSAKKRGFQDGVIYAAHKETELARRCALKIEALQEAKMELRELIDSFLVALSEMPGMSGEKLIAIKDTRSHLSIIDFKA